MRHLTRASWAASLAAIVLVIAGRGPALSQASPSADGSSPPAPPARMCVLTADEAATLLGQGEYTIDPDSQGCTYTGPSASLDLDWTTYWSIEHEPDAEGVEVTIGDQPGWYEASSSRLFVDTGYRVYGLSLWLDGEPASLERIQPVAEVVIPRLVAQDQASPAYGLADLFPAELGGQPLKVVLQMSGEEWVESMPDEVRSQVLEMLAAQGATPADLGIASASLEDGGLSAIRVLGGSAAEFAVPLLAIAADDPEMTSREATIDGKEVLVVSAPSQSQDLTVYPSGEIAWLLMMDEALVTEALGRLP